MWQMADWWGWGSNLTLSICGSGRGVDGPSGEVSALNDGTSHLLLWTKQTQNRAK